MSFLKILKSNNLIFFVIALILMGFAVHSLGNRKNNMIDGLSGSRDLSPSDVDGSEYDSDSDGESEQMPMPTHPQHSTDTNMDAKHSNKVAHAATSVPKPVQKTDPKDLLPKDKSDSFHNRDLINAGRFISQQSEVLRNANLQLRSDPPVGKAQTGPFNQPTIEPDMLRPQFELGGATSSGGVTGVGYDCPMWSSADIKTSNNAILPPTYKNVSYE